MSIYITMTDPSGARQEVVPGLMNELLAKGWKHAKVDAPLAPNPPKPEPAIPAPAATPPVIVQAVEEVVGKPSVAEDADEEAEAPTPQAKDAAPRTAPSTPSRGPSSRK